MLASQLTGPARVEAVDAPEPAAGPGEVLVALERASVCGSDVTAVFGGRYRGGYPGPPGWPGHEGVGRVLASRSDRFAAGESVLTVPLPGRAGCFAERQAFGEDFLVPLPAGADPARLVVAQQLGTVLFAFRRYWPSQDGRGRAAAILGAGSAGLLLLQLALRAGFETAVVGDVDGGRLAVARSLGADQTVHVGEVGFAEAVRELTGEGADLVVEAAGPDSCRSEAVHAAARGGRVGFFGLPEQAVAPFPVEHAFRQALTIEMAGQAQLEPGLVAFADAVALIAGGEVDVDPLLGVGYGLADVGSALEAARDHKGLKVAVIPPA